MWFSHTPEKKKKESSTTKYKNFPRESPSPNSYRPPISAHPHM